MNRKSSIIIAAGLVFALMAGTVSRAVTLHSSSAAAPVRIVVQTATPATAAPATSTANYEKD
jgi:predicted neutral ceramidase superfamily lipid hydrolase